ncbi:hypothetical protein ABBQ38_008200 [Trebouxia sp. C0009 RCD-2024]
MATSELLLLDAGEGLLGESSGSLFDCLDYDTGVDDLLSDGRRASQFSSPMPSHLMQTFADNKSSFGTYELEPSSALLSMSNDQAEPIPCMAQELELQARRLEEQHLMQIHDRCDEVPILRVPGFTPITVHQSSSTRPSVISFTTHSSVAASKDTSSKGESKAKSRTIVSTPASISLAVKNNQGVQAGQGCMQPGAWRGCKKSAWCNRENRHRGLCNSRATIPAAEAFTQASEAAVEEQPSHSVTDSPSASTLPSASPMLVTPQVEEQVELYDSEPGSCSDLDTHSVYACFQPPPMVQQHHLQPLVHCNSMSSEEGRLSSMDLELKADQFLQNDEGDNDEQLVHIRPDAAVDMQYTSDTEYSDEDDSAEEEDDDISVCSGSTISAGGQSCTASDLMNSGFDDAYCAGSQLAWGAGGPIRTKPRSNGVQRCVNTGLPGQACTACQAQSTPVWRAGPMGPKTLCNACGVRWMKHSKRK